MTTNCSSIIHWGWVQLGKASLLYLLWDENINGQGLIAAAPLSPAAKKKENTERELLFSVFPRDPSPSPWCIQNSQASQTQGDYEPCNLCFFFLLIKIMFFIAFDFFLFFFFKFVFSIKTIQGLGPRSLICFVLSDYLFPLQFICDVNLTPFLLRSWDCAQKRVSQHISKGSDKDHNFNKNTSKNQPPYTLFPSDLLKSTWSQNRSKCAYFRFEASRQMKWPDICLLGLPSEELTKRVTAFKQLPGEEDICLCFTSYSVLRPCLEKSMWGLAAIVLRQPVVIWLLS